MNARTHAHTHAHSYTHGFRHTYAHARTHTHAHTHERGRAHTHAYAHTPDQRADQNLHCLIHNIFFKHQHKPDQRQIKTCTIDVGECVMYAKVTKPYITELN
jgi:hypothetical protein